MIESNARHESLLSLTGDAETAAAKGDWSKAVTAYEELVRLRPEKVDLKLELGRAYEELGRLDDVIRLMTEPSVAGLGKAKVRLVKAYLKLQNYAAALPLIEDLLASAPDTLKFRNWQDLCQARLSGRRPLTEWLQEGRELVSSGRPDEAEQHFLELLSEYPQASRGYFHLGQIYALEKRWKDAILQLRAGLAIDPGDLKLRTSLARALFKAGDSAEAVALLDVEGLEEDADGLFLLQRCHMDLQHWKLVDEVAERLLAMLPRDDALRKRVSKIRQDAHVEAAAGEMRQARSGDPAQAIQGCRDLADRYPDSALAWLKLGTVLSEAEMHEEAAAALRDGVRLHPKDLEIRKALTRAVIDTSDEQDILSYVQDAIAADTADFECFRWLARYHAYRDDWRATRNYASLAVAKDPEHASARILLVHALMKLGCLPEALGELDIIISRGSKQVEALQLKADIFIRMSRFEEAIDLYHAALDAAPKDPLVSYKLSQAALLQGDIEGFHRFFEKRRELSAFVEANEKRPFRDWNGELSIEGKLLIWCENPLCLGQNIMHMALLRPLTALGLSVVVEVDSRLANICRRSFSDCTIVNEGEELPAGISHHVPLASVSRWFKPDLASFNAMQPYLVPDPQLVSAHRGRFQQAAGEGQLLVGISWANRSADDVEPLQLDQLLDAIALPNVTLVNLGMDSGPDSAAATTGKHVIGSGIEDGEVGSLAAVIDAMDLIVGVDQPAIHLAGAIGATTFLLLPPVPAAHWLANGQRAIWYPATRLVRRKSVDPDWEASLAALARTLRDFVDVYDPNSWLPGPSVQGKGLPSAATGTMLPGQIAEAVRSWVAQGVGADGPEPKRSDGAQLQTLSDLPIEVDPAEIEASMGPFLVTEADDQRWNEWHDKLWRHTVDRLVSGREAHRDRQLIERDYAVWATMGYERYRTDRENLQGTPWWWRGQRLSLDGAGAARLRALLFAAVLDQLKPRRVLEVGSGNGINLLSLAGAYPQIEFTGLELTQGGVQQARVAQAHRAIGKTLQTYSPLEVVDPSAIERIHFLQGDASAMPFEAGSFDLVLTVLAVEQMESIRSAALSQISRVTSGHVLMLEPFRDMNEHGLKRFYAQSRGYFRGSIGELPDYDLAPLWATADFPQETFLGTALVLAAKQAR